MSAFCIRGLEIKGPFCPIARCDCLGESLLARAIHLGSADEDEPVGMDPVTGAGVCHFPCYSEPFPTVKGRGVWVYHLKDNRHVITA